MCNELLVYMYNMNAAGMEGMAKTGGCHTLLPPDRLK